MRLFQGLILLAGLVPGLAAAESGMCEYRHPAKPSWDFFTSCDVTVEPVAGGVLRRVEVSNGSKFTTISGAEPSVNGLAARRLDRADGAECFETVADRELICIHPPGTTAPLAVAPAPITPDAQTAALGDVTFGGGEAGFCLLTEAGALVDYGACTRRENCLIGEVSGALGCLTEYQWKSGRVTQTAREADWLSLDGGAATAEGGGCMTDAAAGLRFCYATRAMSAETHPALAGAD